MDASVSALLYTILVDVFIFLCCYILWIMVSDSAPLTTHTNILLPHTWKYREWAGRLRACCKCRRPPPANSALDSAEQRAAQEAVAGVVVSPRHAGEAILGLERPDEAALTEPSASGPSSHSALDAGALLDTRVAQSDDVSIPNALESHDLGQLEDGLQMAALSRQTSQVTFVPSTYMPEATIFEPGEAVLPTVAPVTIQTAPPAPVIVAATVVVPEAADDQSLLPPPSVTHALTLQQALGTEEAVVQVVRKSSYAAVTTPDQTIRTLDGVIAPLDDGSTDPSTAASSTQVEHKLDAPVEDVHIDLVTSEPASSPVSHLSVDIEMATLPSSTSAPPFVIELTPAAATSSDTSTSSVVTLPATTSIAAETTNVTVFPVQEGVKASEQVLVRPPRSKLRFWLLEPLLERLFPPIRVLGANAIDGFIYLKFSQLLILVVALMNVLGLGVLLPIHEVENTNTSASAFVAASIASMPTGSRAFIAHFVVAFVLMMVLYVYVRLLAAHAVKATRLSTALTDDKATVASRRTVHVKSINLACDTEAAVREQVLKLLPVGASESDLLSVSLFYDVSSLVRVVAKKSKVVDEIERLEILATQVQRNPTARIKRTWLKVLHAPGTLAVPVRLEALRAKRIKRTHQIVEAVWNYYERVSGITPAATANGEAKPSHSLHPSPSDSSIASTVLGAPEEAMPPSVPIPGAPSFSQASSSTLAAPKKSDKKSEDDSTASLFTGQAFISFRASATAGEVVKRHRETRTSLRIGLEHIGLRRRGRHRAPHHHASHTSHESASHHLRPSSSSSEVTDSRLPHLSSSPSSSNLPGTSSTPPPPIDDDDDAHRSWDIVFAPKPPDILWDNLVAQENLVASLSRWLVANAALIGLVLFVGVPTLLLHQITAIISSQTSTLNANSLNTRVLTFFTNYLTTMTMWVVNSHYSPFIMTKALDFERHATKSSYAASRFWKSSLFLLINMILLPIFTMTTVADLIGKLQSDGDTSTWYNVLGNAFFATSGLYFAQYLTHQVFVNFGFSLLDLPTYLRRVWRLRTALTKKDFDEALAPPTAGMAYDKLVATFGLLLLNAVSVPLLLPFGLLYFCAQYSFDMYNFRHFKVTPAQNKGIIPTMAARYSLLYLAFWQLVMAALFFSQNLTSYYLFGIFFVVLSLTTFAIYALREFSTRVPIELHIAALRHLDERVTIFADLVPDLRTDEVSAAHVRPQNEDESRFADEDESDNSDDDAVRHPASPAGPHRAFRRHTPFELTPVTQVRRVKPPTPLQRARSRLGSTTARSPANKTMDFLALPTVDQSGHAHITDPATAVDSSDDAASGGTSADVSPASHSPVLRSQQLLRPPPPLVRTKHARPTMARQCSTDIFVAHASHAVAPHVHPHAHRAPHAYAHSSESHVVHARLQRLAWVDQAICPDCLYRHPVWSLIEKDEEVMNALREREETFLAQLDAANTTASAGINRTDPPPPMMEAHDANSSEPSALDSDPDVIDAPSAVPSDDSDHSDVEPSLPTVASPRITVADASRDRTSPPSAAAAQPSAKGVPEVVATVPTAAPTATTTTASSNAPTIPTESKAVVSTPSDRPAAVSISSSEPAESTSRDERSRRASSSSSSAAGDETSPINRP